MARPRLLLLGGAVVAALVVVAIVVVALGSGGSSSSPPSTTTSSSGGGTEAQSTFKGVPQHADTLGDARAPATLTVFEDPQCPYCRDWNIGTIPTVVQTYVRTGRLKVVYRGIEIIGANSLVGLAAEYAAGRQNKLWNMAEALYERQGGENSGWITTAVVKDAGREIGVNVTELLQDMKSAAVAAQIAASERERRALGINATPTFAIQRPLGSLQQLQVSSLAPSDFSASVDQALQ